MIKISKKKLKLNVCAGVYFVNINLISKHYNNYMISLNKINERNSNSVD